jgi:ribosome-associated protein
MDITKGLRITKQLVLPESEFRIYATKAQGPGGQHVNKVSTAVRLHFPISSSSLPEDCKQRLLALHDSRISRDGEIVIRAERYRSQLKNREDALSRLRQLIKSALVRPARRKPTKPGKAARQKRLEDKKHRSRIKADRSAF